MSLMFEVAAMLWLSGCFYQLSRIAATMEKQTDHIVKVYESRS